MTRRLPLFFLSLLPFAALLLAPCLLLWPVVAHGEAFLPAELLRDVAPWRTADPASLVPWTPLRWDGLAEFYPWRVFASETLKSGFLPLWNPHQFCGTPFVANLQSAVFYPPNLLFCLLPVSMAFGVSVLLHLFLTGAFAYLFLRSPALGLGRPAALLGALAWQLCHWQVAWLALPTFLCVSCWLPLALLLTDRAARHPSPFRAAPLGLCLGLMLLAGHLQIALYCFGLTFAYALLRVLPRLRTQGWPLLGCTLLTLALAFGLAAPQLLPTLELARVSHRAGGPPTWAAYEGYVRLALPPVNLTTLFLPGFFGSPTRGTYWGIGLNAGPDAYIENACYSGVLTLLLALAGIAATWRTHAATRFFAAAALAALLLALGTPLNLLPFFGLPGFAQSGSPARILVLWSFCVSVLAAIGAQSVLRGQSRALGKASAAFAALGLLVFAFAAAWITRTAPTGALAANLRVDGDLWRLPLGLLLGAAALVWLQRRGRITPPLLGGLLAGLVALDLLGSGYGFHRTSSAKDVYPTTPLVAFLQAHRAEGRIMPVNRRWSLTGQPPPAILPPNAATVYGLEDVQGYDSLLTGRYFRFAGEMDGGPPAPPENGNMVFTYGIGSRQSEEAGVRFVITHEPLPGASAVFEDAGSYVYEARRALPRVRREEGSPLAVMPGPPTRLTARGSFSGTTQVIVADQWYPGWYAYVSDQEAALAAGPDIFRTVTLTPGQQQANRAESTLEMRYEPEAFRVGLYALCLALGTLTALASAAGAQRLDRLRRRL